MSLRSFTRRLLSGAAALALSCGLALAADQTPPPVPAVAAPSLPCPTCAGVAAAAGEPGCASCAAAGRAGFSLHHKKPCKPYVTHLCPGACFGYFQTQWHRWEDVCPIPYQGAGLSDAPLRPAPPLSGPAPLPSPNPVPAEPKKTGSDAPLPKTTGTSGNGAPMPNPMPMPKIPGAPPGSIPLPPPGGY